MGRVPGGWFAIAQLLSELNARAFKRREGARASLFAELERRGPQLCSEIASKLQNLKWSCRYINPRA